MEEDFQLFDTKDEIVRFIINTCWLTKRSFDSEHFKDKLINPEDCWKKHPEVVKRAKTRELIKTMDDLRKTKDYDMLMFELGYEWYKVDDKYRCVGRHYMDSGLYEALHDPITGLRYEDTIGHVPGYRD